VTAVRETETIIAIRQTSQNTRLLLQGCLVKECRSNKEVISRQITFIATNPEQLHVLVAICCNTSCVLLFRITQTKRECDILRNDVSCNMLWTVRVLLWVPWRVWPQCTQTSAAFAFLEEKDGRSSRNLCV